MFNATDIAHLSRIGYEVSDGMLNGKPSIQRILAHRRLHETDWTTSLLIFIERGRFRLGGARHAALVAAYEVRLVQPWPYTDEDQPPHPGMIAIEVGHELGGLLGFPFSRKSRHMVLDVEPYVVVDKLKAYLGQPDLRIPYDVAHYS